MLAFNRNGVSRLMEMPRIEAHGTGSVHVIYSNSHVVGVSRPKK